MLYDQYKNKMIKLNKFKNNLLKFKWPFFTSILILVVTLIVISILKGKSFDIEIADSFTYGDKISYNCNPLMSKVKRFEFRNKNSDLWDSNVPTHVGKYEVRAITDGLFSERISYVKEFEIKKKDLTLDILDTTVEYGKYPDTTTDGLLDNDDISVLQFRYDNLNNTNTLVNLNLNNVKIVNNNNEDVTDCYNISSNATRGVDIEFSPLNISLIPDISNKVYDGEKINYFNTYNVVKNEIGYNDVITIETTFKDLSNNVVEEPIYAGKYYAQITKTYVNGWDNPNYNIEKINKEFEIYKRDIEIDTKSCEKTYDGSFLVNSDVSASSLVNLDYIKINNSARIINYGEVDNVVDLAIYHDSLDVTSSYNIKYNYGKLKILKKNLNIFTSSATKTYDGTDLFNEEFSQVGLIDSDKLNVISNTKIMYGGVKDNILDFEIRNKDNEIINSNYDIKYTYGKLEILKEKIKLEFNPLADFIFDGKTHAPSDYNLTFNVISGTIYNDDSIISYNNQIIDNEYIYHSGQYYLNIKDVKFNNEDITNSYEIEADNLLINVLKNKITIKPINYSYQFNWGNNLLDSSSFEVVEGNKYNCDDLFILNTHFELNGENIEPFDIGNYDIVLDNVSENKNKLCLDNLSDYDISFNNSTLEILKEDVVVKLNDQEVEYNGNNQLPNNLDIYVSDNKLKNNINVTIEDQLMINSSTYNINLSGYNILETNLIKDKNFNIILTESIFQIKKRVLKIKVKELNDSIYDSKTKEFNNDDYIITSNSFVSNDKVFVKIKDKDDRDIRNSGEYNLIIDEIIQDASVENNYEFIIDTPTKYNILKEDIIVRPSYQEEMFDGSYKFSNNEYEIISGTLYDEDSIDIFTKVSPISDVSNWEFTSDNLMFGAGEYKKYIFNLEFRSGNDYSVKDNYNFIFEDNICKVLKREIVIDLNEVNVSFKEELNESLFTYNSHLKADVFEFGLIDIDSIKFNYNLDNYIDYVGSYDYSFKDFKLIRNGKEIDYTLDYIIEINNSKINVLKRNIDIRYNLENTTVKYDKFKNYTLDNFKYISIDLTNDLQYINQIPFDYIPKFNAHFEQNNQIVEPHNVGIYQIIVDSQIINNELDEYIDHNFNFTYTSIEFEITVCDVVVRNKTQSVTYDGLEHIPLIDIEILYGTFYNSIINASLKEDYKFIDALAYNYEIIINSLEDDDINNYNIQYQISNYYILRRDISIILNDVSFVYDGLKKEYDVDNYLIKDNNNLSNSLIDNSSLEISVIYKDINNIKISSNSIIDANTYYVYIDKVNISDNFNVLDETYLTSSKLIINKRKLTFRAYPITKEYDSKSILENLTFEEIKDEDNDISVIGDINYPHDSFVTNYEYIDKNIGKDYRYVNTFDISLVSIDCGPNFITFVDSSYVKYEILKRNINIRPKEIELVYSGNDLKDKLICDWQYYNQDIQLEDVDRNEISVLEVGVVSNLEIKNAGIYEIEIIRYNDLYNNYNVNLFTTTIEVLKKDVELSLIDNETIVYDARTHENYNKGYIIKEDDINYTNSFKDGSSIDISVKYVDEFDNEVVPKNAGIYKIVIDTYTNNPNYNIVKFNSSQFEITKRRILVDLFDSVKKYDGNTYKYSEGYKIIEDNYNETLDLEAIPYYIEIDILNYITTDIYIGDIAELIDNPIDCGTYYYCSISFKPKNNLGDDVSHNYIIENSDSHKLEIVKADLSLYLSDSSYVYCGKPYKYDGGYILKDSNNNIVSKDIDISVIVCDDFNQEVEAINCGTYNLKLINLDEINNSLLNYYIKESFDSTLTISKLELSVQLTNSNFESIYGNNFDINAVSRLSAINSSIVLNYDLSFRYLKDNIYYEVISSLDCGKYKIEFLSAKNITCDNILLDINQIEITSNIDAYLNIIKRELTIDANTSYKIYDGVPLNLSDFSINYLNILDKDLNNIRPVFATILYNNELLDLTKIDSLNHAGEYRLNSIEFEYISQRNVRFSDNYNINISKNNLLYVIEERTLYLDFSFNCENEITYDSLEHKVLFNVSINNQLGNDSFIFSLENDTFIDAGKYNLNLLFEINNSNIYSRTSDYKFDPINIVYVINKRDAVINYYDHEFKFDGKIHTFEDANISNVAENDNYIINNYKEFIDTSSNNEANYDILRNNISVLSSYNILVNEGYINILKKEINVYSIEQNYIYTGFDILSQGFRIVIDDLDVTTNDNISNILYNEINLTISKINNLSFIDAGKYADLFEINIYSDKDITDLFDIHYINLNEPLINISKRDINIYLENDKTVDYEGIEYSLIDFISLECKDELLNYNSTISSASGKIMPANGDEVVYSRISDVGIYNISLYNISIINNSSNNNSTNNFNINYLRTTMNFEIKEKSIYLMTDTMRYLWDGLDRTSEGYKLYDLDFNEIDLAYDFVVSNFNILKAYKDDGSKYLNNLIINSCEYDILDGNVSKLNNYNVIERFGTLGYLDEITFKYEDTFDYDGTNQVISQITEGKGKVLVGNTQIPTSTFMANVDLNLTKDIINVGRYDVFIDYKTLMLRNMVQNKFEYIYISYDELVSANYKLNFDFSIQINPINILIEPETYKVEYDGNTHTYDEVINNVLFTNKNKRIKKGNILLGDTLYINTDISIKDLGLVYAKISSFKVLNKDGIDCTNNYHLLNLDSEYDSYTYYTKIHVTQRTFNISADKSVFKYDGNAHYLINPTYDSSILLDGHHIEFISLTIPGYSNGFKILDKSNKDVTEYYRFKYNLLKVTGLTISISSGSAEKKYDGTPLTSDLWVVNDYYKGLKMDGLRDGDSLYVKCIGQRILVGTSKNYFEVVIKNSIGEDVTYLYDYISYKEWGTLRVTN